MNINNNYLYRQYAGMSPKIYARMLYGLGDGMWSCVNVKRLITRNINCKALSAQIAVAL